MSSQTPLDEYAAHYAATRGLATNSRNMILATVRQFREWSKRELKLVDLTAELLNGFTAHLQQTLALPTVLKCRCHIVVIWREAQVRGLIPTWPITVAGKLSIEVCERRNDGGSVTLEKFLEETFIPGRLANSPDDATANKYRRTIEMLSWFLGRAPVLNDLASETLDDFAAYLIRHRHRRIVIRQKHIRLVSLARFARAKGLLDKIPDMTPEHAHGATSRAIPKALPGSLTAFYWSKYRPKLLAHADEATLAHHDKIVGHFGAFVGMSSQLVAIGPDKLVGFRAWLLEKNIPANTAEGYLDTVGKIIANTTPEDLAQPFRPEMTEDLLPASKGPAMLLRDFLEAVYFVERDLTAKTKKQMVNLVEQMERWAVRELSLSDLTIPNVNAYVAYMRTRYAATVVKIRRGYLVGIWNLAFEAGYVETEPNRRVARVKVPRKLPRAWTLDELQKIVNGCRALKGTFNSGVEKSLWMKAAILVCYDTGLRLGDLVSLRCEQLSKDGTLRVLMSKTQQELLCRIRPETEAALNATFSDRSRELLLPPPSDRVLYDAWRIVLAASGVPAGIREAFHKVRRTSASYIERDNRGTAGAHLGHMTQGLAAKSYLDPSIVNSLMPLPPSISAE